MIKNSIAHASVTINREDINILGGYDEEFEKAEDYELWMRVITRKIRIENIQEHLVKYKYPILRKEIKLIGRII